MWVILKEPVKGIDYETLAIHLESFNAITIMSLDKKFHLVVQKYFDGHQSNQSNMHCILNAFDTYNETQDFFQEVLDLIHSGESVFDLRSRSEKKEKANKAYL